jgi:hypothetical protein
MEQAGRKGSLGLACEILGPLQCLRREQANGAGFFCVSPFRTVRRLEFTPLIGDGRFRLLGSGHSQRSYEGQRKADDQRAAETGELRHEDTPINRKRTSRMI